MKKNFEIYNLLDEAEKIYSIYPDKSYEMSQKAYNIAKENNLKLEEGHSLISMARACKTKTEINKMLDYSLKAFNIYEEENDFLGQAKSMNLIGIAYFYGSMYEEALKYLLEANDLYKKFKDNFLLSRVLNNIGEVYRESVMYDKALEYYSKGLKICEDNNYNSNAAVIFGNIGEIYFIENKCEEALYYFNKGYEILIKEHNMINLGEIENKLGRAYYTIGDYEGAEELFLSALNRLENVDNKYYSIDAMVNIAKLNLNRDMDKSIYYYEKAMNYSKTINAKKKLYEVYKLISEYYEKTNDFKTALEYYKNFSRIKDEIMTSKMGNKLEIFKIELGYLNDNDKFERIKKRLEEEILSQKHELEKIKKSNELLEKKAYEDELTGISNRRYINTYLNKSFKKSHINRETVVLFMIDIDNFKKYNDYWGHSIGDECLKKVANCIKSIKIGTNHIFGRYGGEEFVYIAEGLNYEKALELGNIIRIKVEGLNINYMSDNNSKRITISVGGAIGKYSEFKSIVNMMQIADAELYKAKNMGKNLTFLKNITVN